MKNLWRLTLDNLILQDRVTKIQFLKDDLFQVLISLDKKIPQKPNSLNNVRKELVRLNEVMGGLKELKSQLILESESIYHQREAAYKSKIMLTPFASLLLVVFSLTVFVTRPEICIHKTTSICIKMTE